MTDTTLLYFPPQNPAELEEESVFSELDAREFTIGEMSVHLEAYNCTTLLEAFRNTDVSILRVIYASPDDHASWIATTKTNSEIDIPQTQIDDLIAFATVSNDFRLVRTYTPLIEALETYCVGTQQRKPTDKTNVDTFIFDVTTGAVRLNDILSASPIDKIEEAHTKQYDGVNDRMRGEGRMNGRWRRDGEANEESHTTQLFQPTSVIHV